MEIVPPLVPPLVYHTRYFRHAPVRLRVAANMYGCACGYVAVCLLRPLWLAQGAIQIGCGVRLAVYGCGSANSTHQTISSSIEPLLSLSGANY